MPSYVGTTSSTNIDGQIGINTSILNGKIDVRLRIRPEDIDLIKESYNLFRLHTHRMYDQQYIAQPNTPPRGSASRNTTSTTVTGASDLVYTVEMDTDNQETMADNIFDLIANMNSHAHTHFHQWDDQVF